MKAYTGVALILPLAIAACAPSAPPRQAPQAATKPVPAAPIVEWRDAPESSGTWSYVVDAGGSTAIFGKAGAPADLTIRCDRAGRTIIVTRSGSATGMMTIATSYTEGSWPLVGNALAVRFRADDPFLDKIAFSRGCFSVAAPGMPTLILPAWAEPARVIEDCRA